MKRLLIENQMERWSKTKYNEIRSFTVNHDYSVDVEGSLHILEPLTKLPFKLRNINGRLTFSTIARNTILDFENFPDFISVDVGIAMEEYFKLFPNHPSYKK